MPPVPPVPPVPYNSHRGHKRGVSVSVHDGKIEVDGVADVVQEQLDRVSEMLDHQVDLPPDVRLRAKTRIDNARAKLTVRLNRLKSLDLDKIGPEMERMGDDIEKEMEGLDKDLEKLGEKFGKDFSVKINKNFAQGFSAPSGHDGDKGVEVVVIPKDKTKDNDDSDRDDDDDDDDGSTASVPAMPEADPDAEADRVRDATAVLQKLKLALDPQQKVQLAKLRADSEQQVKSAKQQLEELSNHLHDSLGDASASEADIASQIDRISRTEATIRKARLLAWVRARSLLTKDQRRQVESALKKAP
jgi:hypothetical protein